MTDRSQNTYKIWNSTFKGTLSTRVSLRPNRWEVIEKILLSHNVKTVLEFGSGISTLLFANLGLKVTSFETNYDYMKKVKALVPSADFRVWNGRTANLPPSSFFDFSLVDGSTPRLHQAELAKSHSNIVAIDDFGGISAAGTGIFSDWTRIDDRSARLMAIYANPSYLNNLTNWSSKCL